MIATMKEVAEYLYAAYRQIRIAEYHRSGLVSVLGELKQHPEQSPIPVQASFEAVLSSAISTTDKLGEAIRIGQILGKLPWPTLDSALKQSPQEAPFDALTQWWQDPFCSYVRAVRVKAVHHYYDKASNNGTYVLGAVGHPYAQQVLNGYSPTLEEFTAHVLKSLGHLLDPINLLVKRYQVESEWEQFLQAEI